MKLFLIAAATVALLLIVLRVAKARGSNASTDRAGASAVDGGAPPPPTGTVDEPRLRADLEAARRDGDRARIEALEDRLRAHEYWKKRNTNEAAADRQRVANEAKTISDWNTNEKRFNNLR